MASFLHDASEKVKVNLDGVTAKCAKIVGGPVPVMKVTMALSMLQLQENIRESSRERDF